MTRLAGRVLASAGLALAMLVLTAAPALADPAVPTNYRSTVTSVTPDTSAARFEVIGGDSFLQVTVEPGHEVLIPGYFDEPYIRIDGDGSVWLNEGSPAYYINLDRYGNSDIPSDADGEGEPRWVQIADGGRYAWHDHRTHWMSPDPPPAVAGDERQVVFPWEVPVIIDGAETIIGGELIWVPSVSGMPGVLAGTIALLPVLAWRRRRPLAVSLMIGSAAFVAATVIIAGILASPADARIFPVWSVFAVVALASAVFAVTRRSPTTASRANLFAALTLLVWAIAAADILWLPILPSALPTAVARGALGMVWWAVVGTIVLSVVGELGRDTS